MECRRRLWLFLLWSTCIAWYTGRTQARVVTDTQNDALQDSDYGSRSPDQQLSKDSNCDCEWRYLKHYEAKGCRPVYEEKPPQNDKEQCTCPWRFDCSAADEIFADDRACVYKKHVYPVGSRVNTTNPCEVCTCVTDYFTQAATISCVSVECPSIYSKTPLPEGCHYVYKGGECCPVGVECPSRQDETTYEIPICEYKGKMYYEGEQIYPDEDPCLICLCSQNWTGINSTTCRQHDCLLERDSRKLKQGCIPIYHEKTCCPIDYHCANDDFDFNTKLEPSFKSEDDEDEMCFFEGRYYPIGHVLDIKHPTNCVTCTCKTPPDFTCIHSSCPPPPNNDYVNCKALYKTHSCCPDYTCSGKSSTACPDPICNGTNCWLIQQENGCAICRCKSRCVPCPDMCQPENPDNECSGCICQLNSTSLRDIENAEAQNDNPAKRQEEQIRQSLNEECKKVNCSSDERCMLTDVHCLKEPCFPEAKCERVYFGCGQPICPSGCEQIGNYENNCPICYCRKQIPERQYKPTCDDKFCPSSCTLTGRDVNNCPICNCPQGKQEMKICPESQCIGYNCTLVLNSADCTECQCQLPCKPRECPTGCEMTLELPTNGGLLCGCRCKNSSTAVDFAMFKPIAESCSQLGCQGYNCTVADDENGCPICSCQEPCSTPICYEGCTLENSTMPGRCPGCVCKLSRSARDNTAKECPPPTCQGYNCSVVATGDGCQKCICESPCEESPQCPSHCRLEEDAPAGRCRGCICSLTEDVESPVIDEDQSTLRSGDDKAPHYIPRVHDLGVEKREDPVADYIPLPGKDIVPEVDTILHNAGSLDEGYFDGHAYPVFGENGEVERNQFLDSGDQPEEKESYDYAEEKGYESDEKCRQKNCPSGQTCVIRRLQCIRTPCPVIPVCIDNEPVCPIPMCAVGCMVMKWDDEVCPSCFCGIIRGAQGRVCPRHPCLGRRCYNVIGDDGCPSCKCDAICIPPTCSPGCYPDFSPPEGKCPTCQCPSQTPISQASGTSPSTESVRSQSVETTTSAATSRTPTVDSTTVSVSALAESDEVSASVDSSSGSPVSPGFSNIQSDSVGMEFTSSSVDPLSPQKPSPGSAFSVPQHSIKGRPKIPQDLGDQDDAGFINAFEIRDSLPNFGERTTVTVVLPTESYSQVNNDDDVPEVTTTPPSEISKDLFTDSKIGSSTSKPLSTELYEENGDSSFPLFDGVMSNLSLKELFILRQQLKKQPLPSRASTPSSPVSTDKPKTSPCRSTQSPQMNSDGSDGTEKETSPQKISENVAKPEIFKDDNVQSPSHHHQVQDTAGSQISPAHVPKPEHFQDDIFSHHRDKIQIISAALQSHVLSANKHDSAEVFEVNQPTLEGAQAVHQQNHHSAVSAQSASTDTQQQHSPTVVDHQTENLQTVSTQNSHLSNESRISPIDMQPAPPQNHNAAASAQSTLSHSSQSQTFSRPSPQNQILSISSPQASREPVSSPHTFGTAQYPSSSPGIPQHHPVDTSHVPPQSPQLFQPQSIPSQQQHQVSQQHPGGINHLQHPPHQASTSQVLSQQTPQSQIQQQHISAQIMTHQQQGLQQTASSVAAQQENHFQTTAQNSQQQSFVSVAQPPAAYPSSVQNIQHQIHGHPESPPSSPVLPQQSPTVLEVHSNSQGSHPQQSQSSASAQQPFEAQPSGIFQNQEPTSSSTFAQHPAYQQTVSAQSQQPSSSSVQHQVRPVSTAYGQQQVHSPPVTPGQQSPSAQLPQTQNQLPPAPPSLHQVHSQSLPSALQQTPSQSSAQAQQQHHVQNAAQAQQVHISADVHQHSAPEIPGPFSPPQQSQQSNVHQQSSWSQVPSSFSQHPKPQIVPHHSSPQHQVHILTLQSFQQQNSPVTSQLSSLPQYPNTHQQQQQQHTSSQISPSLSQSQSPQSTFQQPSHQQYVHTSGSSVYQQSAPSGSASSGTPQHSDAQQQQGHAQISSHFSQEHRQQLPPQQTDQPQHIQTLGTPTVQSQNSHPGIAGLSTSQQHSSGISQQQQHTPPSSSELLGGQFSQGASYQPSQQHSTHEHQSVPQLIPQQNIPSQSSNYPSQSQASYLNQVTQKPPVQRPPSKTNYNRPQQQFYPPLPTSQQSTGPHSTVPAQQGPSAISQQLPSGSSSVPLLQTQQASQPSAIASDNKPLSQASASAVHRPIPVAIHSQQTSSGFPQIPSQHIRNPPVQQNLSHNVSHTVSSAVADSGIPSQTNIYSPETSQTQQSSAHLSSQPSVPHSSNQQYLESIQDAIPFAEPSSFIHPQQVSPGLQMPQAPSSVSSTLPQKPDAINVPPQSGSLPFQQQRPQQQHPDYGSSQFQTVQGSSQVVPQQHNILDSSHAGAAHSQFQTNAQSTHQSFHTQSSSQPVAPVVHQQGSNVVDQNSNINLYPQQPQTTGGSHIPQFQGTQNQQHTAENAQAQSIPSFQGHASGISVSHSVEMHELPSTHRQGAEKIKNVTSVSVENDIKLSSNSFGALSTASPSFGLGTNVLKPPIPVQQVHTSLQRPFGSYQCPTPHCNGYNCSLIRGQDGCQKCVCDSPCAPCPPHCVKTKTASEGRCPICDCTGAISTNANTQCPVVSCTGPKCRKVKDSNGCYTCICDPQCDPPKCDPGCEILTDVPPGQCPGCVCKVTVVQAVIQKNKQCPTVSCARSNCKEVLGSDGCPKCFCEQQLCPAPKCDPGCDVQSDVAAGQCPTCVCPEFPAEEEEEEDEHYCPNLFCADYGCREIPGPAGCPICHCDPICRPPVCDPGCKIVSNKYLGRCPVCICSSPLNDTGSSSKTGDRTTVTVSVEPVVAETSEDADAEPTTTETAETTTTEMTTTEEPTTTTEVLTTTTCPPPVCAGLQCRKLRNPEGCVTCKCRFKCPNPRCQGNCYAETNPPPHRCPGCICPSNRRPTRPRSLADLIF